MEQAGATEIREGMPRRYVIVSFLGVEEPPQSFLKTLWPLHVTIIPPFSTSATPDELNQSMQNICRTYGPIHLKEGRREQFGLQKDIPVTKLDDTDILEKLHRELKEEYGEKIVFPETQYPFTPHVTDSRGTQLSVEQEKQITSISLVEIDGEKRNILFKADLNQNE